jgi:UDP-N-acetylglucosamine transferase subunit ALG13
MIFVTVGSSHFAFDRLLHAVGLLETDEERVVQYGPSSVRPAGATCIDFVPLNDLAGYVRRARAVVCHGGMGSILLALAEGKRPYVVPRLARFGETTDDHQVETARRLEHAGLVHVVDDPRQLATALVGSGETSFVPWDSDGRLVRELSDYIRTCVARPARAK